ncbi:uncharacterized protein [Chelonus insularis]|uniref:uncharacterized protein n=1 Tax=Chelonus insularis TaxID=460826 RepID=UPI00158937ED|nr:uncharacterized protein LOC118067411 [Chelonus insularis]
MKTKVNQNLDDYNDRRDKTLYVRLPHTIHNADEVQKLFPIPVEVRLLRQSSRNCHVVFSTVEEKMKNLEHVKQQVINGKRVYASLINKSYVKRKLMKKPNKKLVIPEPSPSPKITRTLYVCNINMKSTIDDLKEAFGEVSTAAFINKEKNKHNTKEAIVKLSNGKLAAEYLKNEKEPPCLHGNKLIIKPDTRKHRKSEKLSDKS